MNDMAERCVIGALFIDINAIHKIYNDLKPEMFLNRLLGCTYKEIIKAYDVGAVANIVTVSQSLENESFSREQIAEELKTCLDVTITSAAISGYAETVIQDYKTRILKGILSNIQPVSSCIESQIGDLLQKLEELKQGERSRAKSLDAIVDEYQSQYFCEQKKEKLFTGFSKLDDITGGLESGDVIVIGARPGVGKSAFVSQMILQMAKRGKKIGFYNLEMSDKQVYERLLSNQSGIQLNRIRRAVRFLGDEKERFEKANQELKEIDILISSGTKTVSEIRNESRHQELDCIVIDYLQLVRSDVKYQSRASEVGAISKAIKSLAMELNIPIIALSQLNRTSEMRDNKEPTMGELREAGDIEQDASIIILLWNLDTNDKTKKALKVDKNRQGELGKIVYRFQGNEMHFEETEEEAKAAADGFQRAVTTPFD